MPFENEAPVAARICVVRKSKAAIAQAIKKLDREASKKGSNYSLKLSSTPSTSWCSRTARGGAEVITVRFGLHARVHSFLRSRIIDGCCPSLSWFWLSVAKCIWSSSRPKRWSTSCFATSAPTITLGLIDGMNAGGRSCFVARPPAFMPSISIRHHLMGKVRCGGYIFEWWIGDHAPRHVHVSDSSGELLGRIALETGEPLDDWKPPKKVLDIIRQLQQEKRL